jgi:hypothetical protein
MDGNALSNITIMGLAAAPACTAVTFNGKSVGHGVYNATSQTFFIGQLEKATSSGAWAVDWTLKFGAGSQSSSWLWWWCYNRTMGSSMMAEMVPSRVYWT